MVDSGIKIEDKDYTMMINYESSNKYIADRDYDWTEYLFEMQSVDK